MSDLVPYLFLLGFGILCLYLSFLSFAGKYNIRFGNKFGYRPGGGALGGDKEKLNSNGRYIKSFYSLLIIGIASILFAVYAYLSGISLR